jgi:hypothetical protein
MGLNWGEALASGVAAGAQGVAQDQQQQQSDAEWLKRAQAMEQINQQNAEAKERFLLSLGPPKTEKEDFTDDSGKVMTRAKEWVPPSTDGKTPGHWNVTATTPSYNQERIDETLRNHDLISDAKDATRTANQQASEARLEASYARIAAENARHEATGAGKALPFSFQDYANAPPEQRALYDRFRRGEQDPGDKADLAAREATLKETQANPDMTDTEKANSLYQNQTLMHADPWKSVGGGASTTAKPMGQFASPQKAAPSASPQGAPYREGQIIYDKQGNKYVVKNGQPVPA